MKAVYLLTAAAFLTLLFGADRAFSEGNATRGQRVFGACAACHSLQPDQSMTGPSLAGLWNRKAGSLASFSRYSPALKSANIVWNDKTLDDWITNPQHLVPGNEMTFDGIRDARQRADLLAFLKQATQHGASVVQQSESMRGMGGMGDHHGETCGFTNQHGYESVAGCRSASVWGEPFNHPGFQNCVNA